CLQSGPRTAHYSVRQAHNMHGMRERVKRSTYGVDRFVFAQLAGRYSYARIADLSRRCGRVVEGTPLLREHTAYTRIEGSNPSISASSTESSPCITRAFFIYARRAVACPSRVGRLN